MPSSKASPGARGPWSDGETSALVDAWGLMYLRRDPEPLTAEEWRVVCSAVNAQRAAEGSRFNRTLVQCQKRVYILKDQYMKELAKGRPTSAWRHFGQLRAFLAAKPPGLAAKTPAASVKKEKAAKTPTASVKKEKAAKTPTASSVKKEEEEVVEEASPGLPATMPATVKNEEVVGCGCELVGSARCCLGKVVKLAEAYESVEMAASPPGFAAKTPAASVKKEKAAKTATASSVKKEEVVVEEASPGIPATMPATVKNEEVVGCGCELVGRARCCPGAVVTKLAEVYERVEMERLNVEEKRMEKISCCSLGHKKMKIENRRS